MLSTTGSGLFFAHGPGLSASFVGAGPTAAALVAAADTDHVGCFEVAHGACPRATCATHAC